MSELAEWAYIAARKVYFENNMRDVADRINAIARAIEAADKAARERAANICRRYIMGECRDRQLLDAVANFIESQWDIDENGLHTHPDIPAAAIRKGD